MENCRFKDKSLKKNIIITLIRINLQIIGIKLLNACNNLEKEAGKVPQLCYSLIKTLAENDHILQKDLKDYASQANQLKPTFSAAGYFNINYELTMPIFGSIFTYVIVLLQFKNV